MKRLLVAVAAIAAAAAGGAVYAVAGHNAPVAQYTGCLSLASGKLGSFAQGTAPADPCKSGEVAVHLSGGDISDVQTPAAGGLQGGASNGVAALSLQQSYRLPQGCGDSAVAKWSSSAATWTCAADVDTNTSYDGTTFALSNQSCGAGEVAKGVSPTGTIVCVADADTTYSGANFALSNQSCSSGFVTGVTAAGAVSCGAVSSPGLSMTQAIGNVVTLCSTLDPTCSATALATATCPSGTVVTGGGYVAGLNATVGFEFPENNGWAVSASNSDAFGGSIIQARAVCLRIT